MQRPAYQVNHLFLLMGENPLPNAVAALTLLQPGGTPYLVHTRHTQTQAERLADVLQDIPTLKPAQLINLGTNQAEPFVIRQRMQAIARSLSGRIGMNYTGGTKAMSVHAYRSLEQVHPHAIFSYLDSNTLEMVIDNDQSSSARFKVAPELSLDQLFRLHGLIWRSDSPPLTQPILSTAATRLAKFHQFLTLSKAWRSWCNAELRKFGKNEYGHWRMEAELAQFPPLTLVNLPDPLKDVLQNHFGATGSTLSLQVAQKQGFGHFTQLCEWLDGTWLEHYVLDQVQQVAPACGIHDSRLSFRIRDLNQPNHRWDKFEFDVAFMHHYQLFALSCTTTDRRGLCKQKLIEANLRARQLGGAEARVGLVCSYDKPDSLRSELEVATRNRKIAVFGRSDLPSLGQKIVNWVKQNG